MLGPSLRSLRALHPPNGVGRAWPRVSIPNPPHIPSLAHYVHLRYAHAHYVHFTQASGEPGMGL